VLRHARAAYRVADSRSIVPLDGERPKPPVKLRLVDLRGARPQISLGVQFYRRAI
jgi:hypothetical protein